MLPAVDTYIEVIYGDPTELKIAYFNDARWLHLASYLPHRRLLDSLQGLVATN